MTAQTRHRIIGSIFLAMVFTGLWFAICLALRGHA